jgi:alpha-ketoglutarate-dependent taurine dioxygenase
LQPGGDVEDVHQLISANESAISQRLLDHGALLFRGFGATTVAGFARFLDALGMARMDYVYRSTPRTALAPGVYTATEYPAAREIPMHNENSYQRQWPLKVAFCCLQPAAVGGETPLADMHGVSARIGRELLDEFEQRQVRYVRHYRNCVDLSWQGVFQTQDPQQVAEYCATHGIAHEWIDATVLRTVQVCQGAAYHPATGECVFFNQAHLFHSSSLDASVHQALLEVYGPELLPRHAYYGDGAEIAIEQLETVRTAFAEEQVAFAWQAGDILLLDNMRVAHGRRPFTGSRSVLAALLDPYPSA